MTLLLGDCIDVFKGVRGLGAIVADPPAGIGFMGRSWDCLPLAERKGALAREDAFSDYWGERFDVARLACADDAVALIWALPRTADLTMRAIRLGGWQIRDVITHHFGQGWPKNKAALKPASEHWILATNGKPPLDIDVCRVERGERIPIGSEESNGVGLFGLGGRSAVGTTSLGSWPTNAILSHAEGCCRAGMRRVAGFTACNRSERTEYANNFHPRRANERITGYATDGTETLDAYACVVGCECGAAWLETAGGPAPRCECGGAGWWACPVADMDALSGALKSGSVHEGAVAKGLGYGGGKGYAQPAREASEGGASRFFPRFGYYAKAPSGERHAGCEDLYWRAEKKNQFGFVQVTREEWEVLLSEDRRAQGNVHPTVKRIALMRWLHALTGAKKIGDLCGGSGSGRIAAFLDGIEWLGAEVCPQAVTIADARLSFWKRCSAAALARFCAKDEMPERPEGRPSGQQGLFAAGAA